MRHVRAGMRMISTPKPCGRVEASQLPRGCAPPQHAARRRRARPGCGSAACRAGADRAHHFPAEDEDDGLRWIHDYRGNPEKAHKDDTTASVILEAVGLDETTLRISGIDGYVERTDTDVLLTVLYV